MIDIVAKYTTRPVQFGPGAMTAGVGTTGASDQGSFAEFGWPANGLVESDIARNLGVDGFSRQIHHTMYDTVNRINFDYLAQMANAALGFLIEASFVDQTAAVFDLTGVDQTCAI
jgi:hypothetical protein